MTVRLGYILLLCFCTFYMIVFKGNLPGILILYSYYSANKLFEFESSTQLIDTLTYFKEHTLYIKNLV